MEQFNSKNNKSLLESVHKLNCVLTDKEKFDDSKVILEYVIDKKKRNDFQLKAGFGGSECTTLICRVCGSDKFIVGQAEYLTVIKCEECDYELRIHEG